MNKEELDQRLVELRSRLEQVQANGNALLGAIQECNYWLMQLEAPVAQVEMENKDGLPAN